MLFGMKATDVAGGQPHFPGATRGQVAGKTVQEDGGGQDDFHRLHADGIGR